MTRGGPPPDRTALARQVGAAVAALAGLALLLAAFRLPADAAWLRIPIVAAVAFAAWRPADALLVLAGLGPVIGVYGAVLGAPFSLRELLVLGTLTGWSARLALIRTRRPLLPPDLAWPLLAATAVILSSLAIELHGHRQLVGPEAFDATARHLLDHGLLRDRHVLRGLHGGAIYLEGLAIFAAAAALCTRLPGLTGQATAMAVAGGAGAAFLNIQRPVVAAQRALSPLDRLGELLVTTRVSVGYSDVNAAGSYFAMMLFPAGALAVRSPGWRRALWSVGAAALFGAAWLTGSRAAVAAIVAVMLLVIVAAGRRRVWSARAMAAAMVLCLLGAAAVAMLFPNRLFGPSMPIAVQIRLEMARISLAILGAHPLFGAGVGGFHEASAPLLATSSIASYYTRENAHNNLLQWIAELGLVGVSAFAWLIWCAARRVVIGLAGPDHVRAAGLGAGLGAFGLTAMFGHPLLTPEVNHGFWLLLGIACGTAPPQPSTRTQGLRRAAGLALIGLACALIPWRLHDQAARLPLEHVRYGVSPWQVDADGLRYQTFTREATLFVPSTARAADIPLKLDEGELPVVVEVRFRGRVADRLTITADSWQTYRLMVGVGRTDRPFLPVQVRVLDSADRRVRIGRSVVR